MVGSGQGEPQPQPLQSQEVSTLRREDPSKWEPLGESPEQRRRRRRRREALEEEAERLWLRLFAQAERFQHWRHSAGCQAATGA